MAILGTAIANLVPSEKRLANSVDFLTRTTNEIVQSGLTVSNEDTARLMQGGPRKGAIPYLNALDTTNVNVSNDVITDEGDTGNLTGTEYSVVRHDLNWGWGVTDLTAMVTQFNALGGIDAGISAYWDAQVKKYAVSSIKGVLEAAGNSAKFGTATTAFSDEAIIDAEASAEEFSDKFDLMFIGSAVRATLQKREKNTFIPASLTNTRFDTYQGKRLITTNAFGPGVTVLARSGAMAFEIGTVPNEIGIEIERKANGGRGGGASILHSRRSLLTHPQGANYLGAAAPTLATLELAASWNLAVALKFFGFRKIVHTATGA